MKKSGLRHNVPVFLPKLRRLSSDREGEKETADTLLQASAQCLPQFHYKTANIYLHFLCLIPSKSHKNPMRNVLLIVSFDQGKNWNLEC